MMTHDICWRCDGSGEDDWLSGHACPECNGSGWCSGDDWDDEPDEAFWDDFYETAE